MLGSKCAHTPPAGQQPIIPPGDCFEYVSGTDLDTKSGLQSGRLEVGRLHTGRPTSMLVQLLPVQFCMHTQMGHQRDAVVLHNGSAFTSARRPCSACRRVLVHGKILTSSMHTLGCNVNGLLCSTAFLPWSPPVLWPVRGTPACLPTA